MHSRSSLRERQGSNTLPKEEKNAGATPVLGAALTLMAEVLLVSATQRFATCFFRQTLRSIRCRTLHTVLVMPAAIPGCQAEALMDAAEIIEGNPDRDRHYPTSVCKQLWVLRNLE